MQIAWQLISVVTFQVLGALATVILLAVLSSYWGERLDLLFPISSDAAISYLSTLGQVSAGLLALYFTAISVVVSTAYSRVPGDIRGLIMREEVGSFYFKVLAFFAAVVTITLASAVFRLPIGALNLLLVTALCLLAIYSFVLLGIQAFNFFEPTSLLPYVSRDLQNTIALVTPGHPHWYEQSFQAHHQRDALRLLKSFGNLVRLAADARSASGLQEIATHLVGALLAYSEQKHTIPSSSFWFARTYKHKDWLTTSYSEVGIALSTGTSLQPESVPDHQWFEEHVARTLARLLAALAEIGERASCVRVAYGINAAFGLLGERFLLGEAMLIMRELDPVVRAEVDKVISGPLPEDLVPLQERLALLDVYTTSSLNFLLGYAKAFEGLSTTEIARRVERTQASGADAIYRNLPLPRLAIEKLEFIHRAIRFETRALGHAVSPMWFRTEACAHALVNTLRADCEHLCKHFEAVYGAQADEHLVAKRYVVAAVVAKKGLEGCSKLRHGLVRLRKMSDDYMGLDRSKEYSWPLVDWAALETRTAALRERLIVLLAQCLPELGTGEHLDRLPDYFGEAYSFVADACFDAALRGQRSVYLELFPRFFQAALRASERLRVKFGGDERRAVLVLEPLADLMSLSGYSLVFSELNNASITPIVEAGWKAYFASLPSNEARKALIDLLCAVVMPSLQFTSREMLRSRWKQACRGWLREKGFISDTLSSRVRPRVRVSHPSALVRAFVDRNDISVDGEDVFLAQYVFALPEAQSVKPPWRVASFITALARETAAGAPPLKNAPNSENQ